MSPISSLVVLLASAVIAAAASAAPAETLHGIELTWYGHASVKAKAAGRVVYFDPWKLPKGDLETADLILITHPHGDHCSPPDVARIRKGGTRIVTVEEAAQKLGGKAVVIECGQTVEAAGLKVTAVPAYNLRKKFHPKEKGWVGLIVELAGKRLYHAGDTDLIPEMSQIKCDLAFLPCGGKYTMDAKEAALAASRVKPKVAIPIHYGDIVGTPADAKRFEDLCKREVKILKSAR